MIGDDYKLSVILSHMPADTHCLLNEHTKKNKTIAPLKINTAIFLHCM